MINKLLIGITFFFKEERLKYLKKVAANLFELAGNVEIFIVTNTNTQSNKELIIKLFESDVSIIVPQYIGHPYLLTWGHLDIFRQYFESDPNISHFMYLEDDIEIKKNNIEYWIKSRELLRPTGLIPSFLRYELNKDNDIVSTDVTSRVAFSKLPKVDVHNSNYCFVNLPQPYQGMYLLDRDQAKEHFYGPSSSPDFGIWGIREKAAQGLTFTKFPKGCYSRNFIGFHKDASCIDKNALIHHTPNNYANDYTTKLGKIKISEMIYFE